MPVDAAISAQHMNPLTIAACIALPPMPFSRLHSQPEKKAQEIAVKGITVGWRSRVGG
jgi:hypothetical protein